MKRTALLLIALMFFVQQNVNAQTKQKSKEKESSKDFTFTKGSDIKKRKLAMLSSLAGYDAGAVYLVGFRPVVVIIGLIPITSMKYVFQSYDIDNMSINTAYRTNAFGKQFKHNRFLASDMFNEEPYMFTYENVNNKGKESLSINYYSIDKGTMKPSAKSKLVSIPKLNIRNNSKFRYVLSLAKNMSNNEEGASRLNFLRSPDKQTFYIVSIAEDKNSKKNARSKSTKSITQLVKVYAFDNNMESIWEKDDKIKFDKAGSFISGIDVDNNGTVYFTVKEYEDKKKGEAKKGGKRNYHYKLFYINKDAEEIQTVSLDLGDKFVTEMSVKVLDDSIGPACTGFYYDDNSKRRQDDVSGAFLSVVDKSDNTLLDEGFYEFGDDIYSQDVKTKNKTFFGKTKTKQNDAGTEDIVLRKVFVRPDGNIVLTGERYYMYVVTTTTGTGTSRTTRTEYHYIHNDILATCISPAGQTEWSVRIPKFQHQVNGTFLSSFVPAMNGNDIYFIYNDHSDNNKLTKSGAFSGADLAGKNNVLSIVKLDADGDASKFKLTSKTEMEGMTAITSAINIGNKKVILPVMSRWGRLLRYGIVDFKKPVE